MTARDELVELSEYAWQRLRARLTGLTDDEYRWSPVPGSRTVRAQPDGTFRSDGPAPDQDDPGFTTLSWRLAHIADFLREDRNGPWLGQPASAPRSTPGDPGTAAEALAALDEAHDCWQAVLAGTTDESLSAPIGKPAGRYGKASRYSFALHVVDELIHHSAEAALLRDLYAATAGKTLPAG
jgi:uncharacterized damage-inducible protein DinB